MKTKIAQEQRQDIRLKKDTHSVSQLARDYGVSRRLIQFILFPERAKRNRELGRLRNSKGTIPS